MDIHFSKMEGSVTLSFVILLSMVSISDAQTATNCNFNADLQGTWYNGYNDAEDGVVPYYTDSVRSDDYDTLKSPESPYNSSTVISAWQCSAASEEISGSYYTKEFFKLGTFFGHSCASYTLSSAKDIKFFRRISQTDLTLPAANCSEEMATKTDFRVDVRLPLNAGDSAPCPWSSSDLGSWQASLGDSATGNSTLCNGDQNSIINLQEQYMEMTMCQNTNNAAGIAEASNVRLRCLRKWQGSEMASLGNDSLGTFFIVAEDNPADLAAGKSSYYVARFLKRSSGNYVIGIDWTQQSGGNGLYTDATMNPETADTIPNGKIYELRKPSKCCNYPDALEGVWYIARAQVVTSGPQAGKREFNRDEVYTCKLEEQRTYENPSNEVPEDNTVHFPCYVEGKDFNGSFVIIQFVGDSTFLTRCIAYHLSPSKNLRFVRILPPGQFFSTTAEPELCNEALANAADTIKYRVDIRLPVDDGTTSCPWAGESYTQYQATVKLSDGTTPCSGDQESVFDLKENTFKINTCQDTNIAAASVGISETADTEFKCLRTWTDSEMSPLGNDTTGTYFLMAKNDATTLASGSLALFIAKYIKKSDGSYVISIDWSVSEKSPFGKYMHLNMDPETAYTDNDKARVYALMTPPEPSSSPIPESSDPADGMSSSDDINPSASDAMDPSASDAMDPSAPDPMDPSASDAMDPSASDAMDPSASDAMDPSASDAMDPSASDAMDPSASDAMDPSASDAMDPSASDAMDPSASDPMDPSASDAMDPSASDAMDPSASDAMDPSASDAMDPSASDAMDPSASDAMDPSASDAMDPSASDAMGPSGSDAGGSSDASVAASPSAGESPSASEGVNPSPTASSTPAIAPTSTSEVPPTSQAPKPTRDYTKDIGEGDIHINEDFDTVTGGNPEEYCASIEDEIAEAAGVAPERVDAICTEDENGKLDVKAQIFNTDDPNDIPFEQALLNLERSQDQGTLSLPAATIDAPAYGRYILKPDGTRLCLGDTCDPGTEVAAESKGSDFDDTLVFTIIGIGVFIILITIILVIFCVYNEKEPDMSQRPFAQEEGFGMAKHWQADYVNTMKPDMNGHY